jgi:PAS domain-containing protein
MTDDPGYKTHLVNLFRQLFDSHPANVCMLDLSGHIVAVNQAWMRFAHENELPLDYTFEGINYLETCAPAAQEGDADAAAALTGLLDVLTTGRRNFSLVYPCHAPHEKRWYRLWVEPQMPDTPVVIVAHKLERFERVGGAIDPNTLC